MRDFLMALWRDESGQDLAEYAMLIGLIAVIAIGAVALLGEQIVSAFNTITDTLGGQDPFDESN